jgi:hypothetical protein
MFFIDIFTCDKKYIKCYKKLLFLKKNRDKMTKLHHDNDNFSF